MIDLGEAMALDLGHIVTALVGDEPGAEERLKEAMQEQADRTRKLVEDKIGQKVQEPQPTGQKNWMAWESKPAEDTSDVALEDGDWGGDGGNRG
jgi:hypothetical protein